MKRIEVAVGVIFDTQGRVLIGQRTVEDDYYQKWEFPGGKLEPNESAQLALKRELQEELGIDVQQSRYFMTHTHDYPDRSVRLFVYVIDAFCGEILGKEGQALRWVELGELKELDFLQGNQAIIEQLILS